jgi:hypothetical protein
MTEAGVVCFIPDETTIIRDEERKKLGLSLGMMKAIDDFPGAFDSEMRRLSGGPDVNFYIIRD